MLLSIAAASLLAANSALAAPLVERSARFHKRWSYKNYFDLEGHRGARGQISEATLPAFAEGLKSGITTIELDVALTKDNHLIVWHDEKVDPLKVSWLSIKLA